MRLSEEQARGRFAEGRVARLATVTRSGDPHIVPIVFALLGDTVYTSVDAKPKSTTALRRLENMAANPNVAVLVDHYSEDWARLWWVRADGTARPAEADEARTAVERLAARYPVYRTQPPPGPVIAIRITRWSGWSAS